MFRFTIRDVLWLMVVVGLGVGWWVDRRFVDAERARHEQRAIEKGVVLHEVRNKLHWYRFDGVNPDFKELEKRAEEAWLK